MTVLYHLKGSRVGVVSYDRPVPSEGIKGGGGIVRPSCTI